jgi:hypothetical protein
MWTMAPTRDHSPPVIRTCWHVAELIVVLIGLHCGCWALVVVGVFHLGGVCYVGLGYGGLG